MRVRFAEASLAVLGVLALLNAGCRKHAGEVASKGGTAESSPVTRVATATPERATVRRTTEEPGQIEAAETTPIYAKLGGYVESVAADIGDKVKKGQVLAVLRVPETEADLKQKRAMIEQAESEKRQDEASVDVAQAGVASAEAKVAEIQAGIRRADADFARWRAEFARIEQLFRERAQTGSLLDETENKLKAAEATREEVRAQVKSAEAALAEAKAHLVKARSDVQTATSHIDVARFEAEHAEAMAGYMKIRAPFDGVITRRAVDTGHLTTPGASGELLFIIVRSDIVTITVGVPENDAPYVNPGDRALVRLQAMEGKTFQGEVTRTAWALDATTRTLQTEIDLPNADDVLRPGLYAYVTIVSEEHKDALTVPATAIVAEGGRNFCVIVEGGHATRREVKLGLSDGKRTEIVSGIREGELVVEANAGSLADGQSVGRIEPPGQATRPKS
ncbi:efflux RND transporter periplasmic adaptor subunit [Aquisphaera insulae]|uniref:efflux RND transporter periplasmic adaptor subunit n=1 Tax=Aquisphaera insulae TaxID=2712864 RepID=UPI0013EDB2A7|nr:efflux RND transporter periplasmic adaptor subunit [Aquisphaera insulae]